MATRDGREAQLREEWKRRIRKGRESIYVHLVGVPHHVEIEQHRDDRMVDHVWMHVDVGNWGRLRLSVNTLSKLNEKAGFDPRMRLGIIHSTYQARPEPMMDEAPALDFRILEKDPPVNYVTYDQDPLEALLLAKGTRAVRLEAWGELYIQDHLGVHQFHSRRASAAIPRDVIGKDGALKFYFPDHTAEMLLFKFSGQP